jgi:hypothetical protein
LGPRRLHHRHPENDCGQPGRRHIQEHTVNAIATAIIWLAIIAAYWAPTIIALIRHLPNVVQVGLVNLFFGWTAIGWIVALIWSFKPLTDAAPRGPRPA